MLLVVRAFDPKIPARTYGEVFAYFRRFIEMLFMRNHLAVFLMFDRGELVPLGKQQEQDARNQDVPYFEMVIPHPFSYDAELSAPFKYLITDRETFRPWFLRLLCHELFFGEYRIAMKHIKDCHPFLFGIYGHRLGPEILTEDVLGNYLVDDIPEDTENYLLVMESSPARKGRLRAPIRMVHGEADLQPYYLSLKLVEQDLYPSLEGVEIFSDDTDFYFIGALFADKYAARFPQGIILNRDYRFFWQINSCMEKADLWIDENNRVDMIQLAVDLNTFIRYPNPVESVIIAYVMVGGDFTRGIYGISYKNIFGCLATFEEGDHGLFEPPNSVSSVGYERLVDRALRSAKCGNKPSFIPAMLLGWHRVQCEYYLKLIMQFDSEEFHDPLRETDVPAALGYYINTQGRFNRFDDEFLPQASRRPEKPKNVDLSHLPRGAYRGRISNGVEKKKAPKYLDKRYKFETRPASSSSRGRGGIH